MPRRAFSRRPRSPHPNLLQDLRRLLVNVLACIAAGITTVCPLDVFAPHRCVGLKYSLDGCSPVRLTLSLSFLLSFFLAPTTMAPAEALAAPTQSDGASPNRSKKSWQRHMPFASSQKRQKRSEDGLSREHTRASRRSDASEKRHTWWKTRLLAGMCSDIRRRAPFYWSDFKDAWDYRVVPATVYMYFAKYVLLSMHCYTTFPDSRHEGLYQLGPSSVAILLVVHSHRAWSCELTVTQHPSRFGLQSGHVRQDRPELWSKRSAPVIGPGICSVFSRGLPAACHCRSHR